MQHPTAGCSGYRTTVWADTLAVAFAAVWPTAATSVYFVLLAHAAPAVQQVSYAAAKAVFVFPLVWVLAVQQRGLGLHFRLRAGMFESLSFGFLVAAAVLVVYFLGLKPTGAMDFAAPDIRAKLAGFGISTPARYVAFSIFLSVAHSLLEEYYWRWFVFGQLARLARLPLALLVSSLAFMAHHVIVLGTYFGWFSVAQVVFSLAVAVGGGVWAWIYHRSGSLYGPWVSHFLVDAAIMMVGYDLGGF